MVARRRTAVVRSKRPLRRCSPLTCHGRSRAAPEPTATEPAVSSTYPTTTLSDIAAGGYVPVDAVPALVLGASDPIEVPLPDGVYWSWACASADDSVEFVLSQLFSGDACRQRFGAEACPSGNNTLYEPSTTITMAPGSPR
jgi:hypothetical protein